jgi:hypothetical protein
MWLGFDTDNRYNKLLKKRQDVRLRFIMLNGREPNYIEMEHMMKNLNSTLNEKNYKIVKKNKANKK